MERRRGAGQELARLPVWEPWGSWPLAWTAASGLVTEPVTWCRSKSLAEVSGRFHLLLPPYLHGLSLYHRRKLNWPGTICSSQNHAGCYPLTFALLDDCKLIVWWFVPVSALVSKLSWLVYNYQHHFLLLFSFVRMVTTFSCLFCFLHIN